MDKLTIAAFEATLMAYMDPVGAKHTIPVLNMLFQSPDEIKQRARKIASALKKASKTTDISVVQDMSKAGGGSLPDKEFQTFAVQVRTGGNIGKRTGEKTQGSLSSCYRKNQGKRTDD